MNEEGAEQMANGGIDTSGESDHLFDEEVDSDMVMDENGNLIDHVDYNDEDDEGDEFVEQGEDHNSPEPNGEKLSDDGQNMVEAAVLRPGEFQGDVSS